MRALLNDSIVTSGARAKHAVSGLEAVALAACLSPLQLCCCMLHECKVRRWPSEVWAWQKLADQLEVLFNESSLTSEPRPSIVST